LKEHGEAYVVVPDGLLNQPSILEYIKGECNVLCVVALPSRTFYSTPKKTYILGLRKKLNRQEQKDPVFTYLVSEIGESRDTRRVPIVENNLSTMEAEFGYFKVKPARYKATDPRCRMVFWSEFKDWRNWLVDRNWTHEEKVALGIVEENFEVDAEGFRSLVGDARVALDELYSELA
jgi:type I restriction enzyme M protein